MPRSIHMVAPRSAGVSKKMKLVSFKPKLGCTMSSKEALNPTAMGRLVDEHVFKAACSDMMQNGLDWHLKPRSTRATPRTASVTRKSATSVTTVSKEAEEMLSSVMGGANLATKHRKRKTLQANDMQLVLDIVGKVGSYGALLG